jgi:NDP-sugar pyrophosphorylase family protein
MQAIVMAGGKGTRLAPFTATFPKPLVPLGDMPVLEVLLRQLRRAGIDEVILAVNHLHQLIRAFCGDGSAFGLRIDYSLEDEPLGTAGPIAALLDRVGETFLVANGDLLTSFDIAAMIAAHRDAGADASIAIYQREIKVDFGLVETDAAMRLTGYREKPSYTHQVSMGLYVLEREAVRPHLQPARRFDMPDLMQALLAAGRTVQCQAQDCVWLDIGRPEDYADAQLLFAQNRSLFCPDSRI